MSKAIAILGLGKYGENLAREMYEFGADVLIVDIDDVKLREMSMFCTSAIRADLTIEEEVAELGLKNMDIVVVAMAGNLAASIMSVAVAKEQNVPVIVAKSGSKRMTSILKRLGADFVTVPEMIGAMQSAILLTSGNFLKYFKVDNNLCMVKMKPVERWIGKNLFELDLRVKHEINVIAIKSSKNWEMAKPSRRINKDDELLIALKQEDLPKLKP